VLELVGLAPEPWLTAGWRRRAVAMRARLGWAEHGAVVRVHAGGASLALEAPCDCLFLATEVNEWALGATLLEHDPGRWRGLEAALLAAALEEASDPATVIPPVLDERRAFERFATLAAREARPTLRALVATAAARALAVVLDDDALTLGSGSGGASYALGALPAPAEVPWPELREVPTALVTGSNGKTTTVRLIAACLERAGRRAGFSCTDGVFVAGQLVASGDYSGPAGTRLVLRDARTEAAVLETARGGILRRGIAVTRAPAAVVTNVSSDHFGEYGIDDLEGLADVKLSVAALVPADGLLVLNADDALLAARAARLAARFGRCPPLGWFALDDGHAALVRHRAAGGATCGVRDGSLTLARAGARHDLGRVAALPLTVGGSAGYNVANLAGAALAAAALGVDPATIALVYAAFGAEPGDNAGRLMRYRFDGIEVLVDYAHNPEGLRGLLGVAERLRAPDGRLALLLGHAGNRQDEDIVALARVAAGFRPDLVVVKENEAQLRGRAPGEVPRILKAALLAAGLPASALPVCASELEAARHALGWARAGDVLALPVHSGAARAAVLGLIDARRRAPRR